MGKIAIEEGRQLVQRYELLRTRLAESLSLDSGVVRIGGGASAVAYLLPGAIAAFRKRHPGVVFQVREAGSRDIETAVARDELELGIVTAPVQRRELAARRLARDRIVLVASKEHPLAKHTSVPARALQGEHIVGFEAGTAVRMLTDGALREAQVQVNVVMELRSVAAILQMVESTRSLGFVSELAVGADTRKRSAIVPIRVRDLHIQRDLMLVKKQGHTLSPAARAFEASFE
jgi:DNA-binding transcriptional LysR family regulator